MHSPYTILGLERGATRTEIKRAFRKLAMDWHPDRNATQEAEERFKFIKAAYEILLDPDRLAAWDAEHAAAAASADDEAPGAADADAAAVHVRLELEEAARGCTKEVAVGEQRVCHECAGNGRQQHAHSVACADCRGIGRRRGGERCSACAGRGYVRVTPCPGCAGRGTLQSERRLGVRIPAGALPGERLRVRRSGAADLYVGIELAPHAFFTLAGRDLLADIPVGIFRLLAGGSIEIPTLAGTATLELAPYPRHGLDYRLAGQGFPGRHGKPAGDLRLSLQPIYPERGDAHAQQILDRLDQAMLAEASRLAPELAAWTRRLRRRAEGGTSAG